jgi:2-oxoisovalerate dehydrogenase E1 component alpha subunit
MLLQSHYRICVYENAIFPFSQAYCACLSVEHIIQAKLILKYHWSGGVLLEITSYSLASVSLLKDLYSRMLLMRMVDDCAYELWQQGQIEFAATCRGHEAAQIGSAVCIEIGRDFTLPYYRDLGVVLTIGMTPYEVFRTYLLAHDRRMEDDECGALSKPGGAEQQPVLHWGYHKRNTITGIAPVATQILHAAGIGFACKLRKEPAVTVAYCGDGAIAEPDFLEGISFAVQQQLPVVFIYEHDCSDDRTFTLENLLLPAELERHCVDGADVITIYTTMQEAMKHARNGQGPVLLEMRVRRSVAGQEEELLLEDKVNRDPLLRCEELLRERDAWDEEWASQLYARILAEVEQAVEDALRDVAFISHAFTGKMAAGRRTATRPGLDE